MSRTKTHARNRRDRSADRYLDLVRRYSLRPIRSKREFKAATKVIEALAVRGEADLDRDELDYLDVLTDLVEAYENEHSPEPDEGTPLARLRALVAEAGMSTADLGRVLGNSGLASQILLGRRELSKTHIRILSRHFKLDASYFL
jgi:HTH-type transcriptional regulator/antitoxin HigA